MSTINNTITITSRLEKGMHNLGRLLGRVLDATTITMSMCSDIIDATYGIGKYAAPIINKPTGITPEILLEAALYGTENALGCAKLGELSDNIKVPLPEGWNDTQSIHKSLVNIASETGKTMFQFNRDIDTIFHRGINRNLTRLAIFTIEYSATGVKEIKLHKICSRQETLGIMMAYAATQKLTTPEIAMSNIIELATTHEINWVNNPQRVFCMQNSVKMTLVQKGQEEDVIKLAEGLNIPRKHLFTNIVTKRVGKVKQIVREEPGCFDILPYYTSVKGLADSLGIPVHEIAGTFPYIQDNGDGTVSMTDLEVANAISRMNGNSSAQLARQIGRRYVNVALIKGHKQDGSGEVSIQAASELLAETFQREDIFDVGKSFILVNGYELKIDSSTNWEELSKAGITYKPGEQIITGKKKLYNNFDQPIELAIAFIEESYTTKKIKQINLHLSFRLVNDMTGAWKARTAVASAYVKNGLKGFKKDISKAASPVWKSILTVSTAKEFLGILPDKTTVTIHLVTGLASQKLQRNMLNLMHKLHAAGQGIAPYCGAVTINGFEYEAIIGTLELDVEALMPEQRHNEDKRIGLKLYQALMMIMSLNGISNFQSANGRFYIDKQDERTIIDWLYKKPFNSIRTFSSTLKVISGHHKYANVVTPEMFAQAVEHGYLDNVYSRKFAGCTVNFNGIYYNVPNGTIVGDFFLMPGTVADNNDYADNQSIDHEDRGNMVMKKELRDYLKALYEKARGNNIPADQINKHRKGMFDTVFAQLDKATRSYFNHGFTKTCVISKYLADNEVALDDEYVEELHARGIHYVWGFRQPIVNSGLLSLYKIIKMSELNDRIAKDSPFGFHPTKNRAIAVLPPSAMNLHRADGDGDQMFFITIPKKMNHIAWKMIESGIMEKLVDNYFKTYRDTSKVGWAKEDKADRDKWDTCKALFNGIGNTITTVTWPEFYKGFKEANYCKVSIGPATSTAALFTLLSYTAILDLNEQAYSNMNSKFRNEQVGTMMVLWDLVQKFLDGIKADVTGADLDATKYAIASAIEFNSTEAYNAIAEQIKTSSVSVQHDNDVIAAMHELYTSIKKANPEVFKTTNDSGQPIPGKLPIYNIIKGGPVKEDQILNNMFSIINGKDNSKLTAEKGLKLVMETTDKLMGDYKFMNEFNPFLYKVITTLGQSIVEVDTIELPVPAAMDYAVKKVTEDYKLDITQLKEDGDTYSYIKAMVNHISPWSQNTTASIRAEKFAKTAISTDVTSTFYSMLENFIFTYENDKKKANPVSGKLAHYLKANSDNQQKGYKLARTAVAEIMLAINKQFDGGSEYGFYYKAAMNMLQHLGAYTQFRAAALKNYKHQLHLAAEAATKEAAEKKAIAEMDKAQAIAKKKTAFDMKGFEG